MNPADAFSTIAALTLRADAPELAARKKFAALAVIAGELKLEREQRHALEVVAALRAADEQQMVFEAVIRERLTTEVER